MYEEILEKIKGSKSIWIFSHDKIDGDGIGCCIAMKDWILRQFPNMKIDMYSPQEPPSTFNFVIWNEKFLWAECIIDKDQYDLALVLDCATLERMWTFYENNKDFFDNTYIINIDHHVSNPLFGHINIVENEWPAACQVIYKIISNLNKSAISSKAATALLTGIMTDTINFTIKPTNIETFQVSKELMELWARRQDIYEKLYGNKNFCDIKMIWVLLNRLTRVEHKNTTCYYTYVSKEEVLEEGADVEKSEWYKGEVITIARQIKDTDFVLCLSTSEEENVTKISFRSKIFDVNKLASGCGGGWHKNASGARLDYAIKPEEIDEFIKGLIDKF